MTKYYDGLSHTEIRAFWQVHICSQLQSGQSGRDYCDEHGLRLKTFYRWRSRLKRKENVVDADVELTNLPSHNFAEVHLVCPEAAESDGAVEVIVNGNRRIRLFRGFDEETLLRAIIVIEDGILC